MKLSRILIAILFYSSLVSASAPSDDVSSLIISGGLSLGNYEAGLNYVLVDALRQDALGEDSRIKVHQDKNRYARLPLLSSSTGASAGAINTIATALLYCKDKPHVSTVTNNYFRDIWIPMGLERLLGKADPSLGDDSDTQEIHIRNTSSPKTFHYDPKVHGYDSLNLGGVVETIRDGKSSSEISDYALSRGGFTPIIDKLRDIVENDRDFRLGCEMDIGVMLTQASPQIESVTFNPDAKVTQAKQSYAVIFRLKTRQTFKGVKAYFTNIETPKSLVNRDFLKLPEQDIEGTLQIEFDSIARTILASSAFPIAFEKVRLGVCVFDDNSPEKSEFCPKSHVYAEREYIDGGYFHNIPLGLAVELNVNRDGLELNPENPARQEMLMFLDPDKLRGRESQRAKHIEAGLKGQLDDIFPAIGTLRKSALYEDHKAYLAPKHHNSQKENSYRKLWDTDRNPKLTGNLLGHFGAFVDPLYREHDYAAGVYDGMIFLAKKQCQTDDLSKPCVVEVFSTLYERHFLTNISTNKQDLLSDISGLVARLAYAENSHSPSWGDQFNTMNAENYNGDLWKISEALKHCECDPDEYRDFEAFSLRLSDKQIELSDQDKPQIGLTDNGAYSAFRPGFFKTALAKQVLKRMIIAEGQQGGENQKKLKTAYLFMPDDHITTRGSIGREKNPLEANWWYGALPSYLGVDANRTSLDIGWSYATRGRGVFDVRNSHWEVRGGLSHVMNRDTDAKSSVMASVGIMKAFNNALWYGWGVHATANTTLSERQGQKRELEVGVEAHVAVFSDKLRFIFGHRDLTQRTSFEDLSFKIQLNNLEELIWLW